MQHVIDPYREFNERALRRFDALSVDERIDFLEKIGILDKKGKLAARYRSAPDKKSAKPKSARASARKLAAS